MVAAEPENNPKPEGKPEGTSEPKTLFPEIMTNQEAFLMYGIFIFALAVFCVVLLVLFITLKRKIKKISSSMEPMGMKVHHGI